MDHRTDLAFGDADNDAGSAFDPPLSGLDVAWDEVPALMLTDICPHPGFAKDLIPIHTLAPSKSRGFAATRGLFVDLQLPDSRALG